MDAAPADAARPAAAWQRLLEEACAPYRRADRFAWHFARGKLGRDPVFRHLLAAGLIPPRSQVLDIGCGQGLLAGLLRAAQVAAHWPQDWAVAPAGVRVHGIDLGQRNIARARAALGDAGVATFDCADMRRAPFPPSDLIVLLDVLHYVGHDEQLAILRRAREALRPDGTLVLRVADAAAHGRFFMTQWIDRVVARLRGHAAPQAGRSLEAWIDILRGLGLQVRTQPMSHGTPFANVLLVARSASGQEAAA